MATAAMATLETRLGRALETGTVRRTAGRDLSDVLARKYFIDAQHAVAELVANSIDAGATKVENTYNPTTDTLTIADTGKGMDEEELAAFFWMGDSPKRKIVYVAGKKLFDPVELLDLPPETVIEVTQGLEEKAPRRTTTAKEFLSEEGTLGEFGLGSVAVKALAGTTYHLETGRDGYLFIVDEDVRSKGDDRKAIGWTKYRASRERHGTVITLHDVKKGLFGRTFSMAKLETRLAREMPLSRADVYVGTKKLESPQVKNAIPFKIDEDVEGVGRVQGMVYLAGSVLPREEQGVLLRVHGRAIGDRRIIDTARYSRSDVAQKITGEVSANGLSAIIGVDRSRFGDHESFRSVVELVGRVLGATKRAYQHLGGDQTVTVEKKEDYIKEAADSLQARLTAHAREITGVDKRIRVECNPSLAGPLATYDPDARVLHINPDNVPVQRIPPRGRTGSLELVFESYAVYAIAKSIVTRGDNERAFKPENLETEVARIFAVLNREENEVAARRKATQDEPAEKINGFRMYEQREVVKICEWDDGLLERMLQTSLLGIEVVAKVPRIHGKPILALQEQLREQVTVYDAIREKYGAKFAAHETRVLALLNEKKRIGSLPAYIMDLSSTSVPFYVFHQTRRRNFEAFVGLTEGAPAATTDERRAAYATRRIGSEHVFVYAKVLSEQPVADRTELRHLGTQANEFLTQAHSSGAQMAKRFSIVSPAVDGIPHCLLGGAYLLSGDKAEALEAALGREGYQRRDLDQGLMRTIQQELQRQRASALPSLAVPNLASNYRRIIQALVLN